MRNTVLPKLCLLLMLAIPACGRPPSPTLPTDGGVRVIPVQAGRRAFTPSVIQALQGDRLLLRVTNEGDETQYLTVKNPRGEFIRSIVLPGGETVDIPLLLTEEGTWRFSGEKTVNGSAGMRGIIQAAPRL